MRFLTPIFYVFYIAYFLACIVYLGATADWLIGDHSFWFDALIVWPGIFLILAIPGGAIVLTGLVFYYLAFIEHWNIFAAIAFAFPGLALAVVALISVGASCLSNIGRK